MNLFNDYILRFAMTLWGRQYRTEVRMSLCQICGCITPPTYETRHTLYHRNRGEI